MAIINGTIGDDLINTDPYLGTPLTGDDTIFAKEGNDSVNGFAGNDVINGDSGNDSLFGGLGNDTLNGGSGRDSLDGGENNDTLNGGSGTDNLFGDIGDDTLNGDSEDDSLSGGDGNDILNGGSENDSLIGGNGNDILNGGSENDSLSGGDNQDTLDGGVGNDSLDGGSNIDNLRGGFGDDTYFVDNTGDIVIENLNEGTDTVNTSVSYTLVNNLENLTLTGTTFFGGGNSLNNTILGNIANNSLFGSDGNDFLKGDLGNDFLDGGTGADNLIGGPGNDTYFVDNIGDIVQEFRNPLNINLKDTVQSSISYTLGNFLEDLTLTGLGAINGIGNALNNTIKGNSSDNIISGFDGNDRITGGLGNDTLDGGNGQDLLIGDKNGSSNSGNDTFIFRFGQSTVTSPDSIVGFAIGSDKIDLLTQGNTGTAAPTTFRRASNSTSTTATLTDVVNGVFTDADGLTAGNQALGVNDAALVVATSGTYLVINDPIAGFQSTADTIVNITGAIGTLPNFGTITVNSFFV
jgi:Ca2+-binding RTX toxin-like protein